MVCGLQALFSEVPKLRLQTWSTMPCSINWIQPPNSKDPRYMEGRGKRKGRSFKVIPLPTEVDRTTAAGRSQWKDVGKNQQIRRMFISGGVSMFAETMRPCLEKHHGRVLSSFSEVVNKSIPFWDKLAEIDREGWAARARVEKKSDHYIYIRKLAEIDREGWAARARVEKKSDHYIYIRKAREKGCGEREVLSLQLSDCESDPDELPGQICDVQSVERHMEMLEHPTETENRLSTLSNRNQSQANPSSEEEVPSRQEGMPQSQKEEGFITRPRITPPSTIAHRADVLYNWTPADRNLRYDKETTWRGRTIISNEQPRRFNRCTGDMLQLQFTTRKLSLSFLGFRDATLIQGSQW
ncbi:unnamed protein product [Strongylus vulgaris]|uniref:Uncharacterized protein n=1 Tax=Strongylus vulgaris TaxID=40348 RepID=A0A3P7J7M6_STRVU|nr:unnamed protein product [Strongylus vulgaris]